ncbi:hypothetical protein E2C01_009803 [Portunus trituberculatus]|uniref:Uncharacterized protein n=1 Tax=Portunus trituberculatus TaxID=210409 RepID=A0A5B7D6P9_PORTR|nr:hypothetical protein [Portunus trituberculatus]
MAGLNLSWTPAGPTRPPCRSLSTLQVHCAESETALRCLICDGASCPIRYYKVHIRRGQMYVAVPENLSSGADTPPLPTTTRLPRATGNTQVNEPAACWKEAVHGGQA